MDEYKKFFLKLRKERYRGMRFLCVPHLNSFEQLALKLRYKFPIEKRKLLEDKRKWYYCPTCGTKHYVKEF